MMRSRAAIVAWVCLAAACVNRAVVTPDIQAAMVVAPGAVPADGVAAATVMLAPSVAGQPLPVDVDVVFHTSSPNTMIEQPLAADANGWYLARLRSRDAGTQQISASVRRYDTVIPLNVTGLLTFNGLVQTAGVPSAQRSRLTSVPDNVADDGQTAASITLQVLDATGAPVPAIPVTFASTGTNNFFSLTDGLTGPDGTLTTTLASTTAETKTVTAHLGTAAVSTQVTFTPMAASTAFSLLQADPNTLTADGVSTTTLTATVRDVVGQPLIGAPVAWATSGLRNTLVVGSVVTDANGVVMATLASTAAETKTVTATSGALHLSQSVTFVAGLASAAQCAFVANPNLVAADNASVAGLRFTARDAQGNGVGGVAVTLSSSGLNNTLTPLSGITDAAGVFSATLVSSHAETKTVTAVTPAVTLTEDVTFLAGPGSPVTSTLTGPASAPAADGTTAVTLTLVLKDAQGNVAAGQSVTVSVTGSNNTLLQATGTTDAAGQLVVTLASTTAEDKTVTATFLGGSLSTTVTFASGPPASSGTSVAASPSSVTADGVSSATLTTTVRDVHGNAVAGQLVTLAASGSNSLLSPASGTTDAAGVFSAALTSTTAETKTITATAGAASASTTVTFTAGAPSAGTTTFVASPTTVTADGSSLSTLTVSVRDANGNPVAGQGVSVASTGTGNTFSPASGSTDASGVFTATFASTAAQAKTLTATLGGVTKTTGVAFTAGAPSGAKTTLVPSPTSVTADGTSTATLTVTVADAFNNPVANQNVTLSTTGSSTTFTPSAGTTDASGVFTATAASTVAQTESITATAGAAQASANLTFTAGAPAGATSSVAVNPNMLADDGTSTTIVTVTAKDAQGNASSNQAVSVSADGTGNSWSATSGSTNASGVWTTTLASTVAQTETITATIGLVTKTTPVTFVLGAPSSSTSTLVASPNSVVDDGVTTTTLQVRVADATNNPIDAQTVSFTSTGASYTFGAPTCSTNTSGTCSVTFKSTLAQTVTVTATFGSVNKTASVAFTVGAPDATTSTLTVNPNTLTADGATTALTVTARDATGNPIAGQSVSLAGSGTSNTFSPVSGATNASGVFAATVSSTHAQNENVIATLGAVNLSAPVTFVIGPMSPAASGITLNPNTGVPADGVNSVTTVFALRDAAGNGISGVRVSLRVDNVGTLPFMYSGVTDANGRVTVALTSIFAGPKRVVARASGQVWTGSVTFASPTNACTRNVFLGTPPEWRKFYTGVVPNRILVTDVDRDGKLDVVESNVWAFSVTRGDGKGGYAGAPGVYASANQTVDGDVCDLNGDTYPDVVTAALNSQQVYIWANGAGAGSCFGPWTGIHLYDKGDQVSRLGKNYTATRMASSDPNLNSGTGGDWTALGSCSGNAAGVFGMVGSYAFPLARSAAFTSTPNTGSRVLICADVTKDGKADVIGIDNPNQKLYVRPGDGSGGLGALATTSLTVRPYGLSVGDLDKDGDLDVVYSGQNGNVYRHLNNGSGTFGAASAIAANPNAGDIRLYDVTGDGNLDVMTVNQNGNSFSVLPGLGNGSFGAATTTALPFKPHVLSLGDFNGDGVVDYFVTEEFFFAHAATGTGGGAFNNPNTYHATSYPTDVAVADINGDGKSDAVVHGTDASQGFVWILLGKGTGAFQDYASYPATEAGYVAARDLNGDGFLDVVTATDNSTQVQVLLNNGAGGFGTASNYAVGAATVCGPLSLVDFSLDGEADLLFPTADANGTVAVLVNSGSGAFGAPTRYAAGFKPSFAVAADFDGDGRYDIATAGNGNASVLLATGAGTFAAPVVYPVGGGGGGNLSTTDLNGDGYTDLVVGTQNPNGFGAVTTFLNDGNGTFAGGSALYLHPSPTSYGSGYVGTADFDLDGRTDVSMVEWWGDHVQVEMYGGGGDGSVAEDHTYDAGEWDGFIDQAPVDLNGDGYPDVAATAYSAETVSIYLTSGTLSLERGQHYPVVYPVTGGCVVADFDNDGHADLVHADTDPSRSISIHLYSGCP
jgi:hypothetical protein